MKKIFFIALFLLVLVGLTACSTADTSLKEGADTTTDATDDVIESSSIEKMAKSGNSVHCSYESSYGTGSISQDVYISGEKFAVYATVTSPEMTEDSIIINDGVNVYIWGSSMEQGMIMSIAFMGEDADSMDIYQEYDYACSAWKPSKNSFDPPSDIEFMDMSDLFGGLGDMSTEM